MNVLVRSIISVIIIFDLLVILWAGVEQLIYEIKKCIKKKKGVADTEDLDDFEDLDFEWIPELSVDVIRNIYRRNIKEFVEKRICQRKEFSKLSDEEKTGAVLLLSSYITYLREEAPVDEQNFPILLYMLNCSEVYDEYEEMDIVERMFKESSNDNEINQPFYYDYLKYKMETPNRAKVLDKCKVAVYEITEKLYGEIDTRYYIWDKESSKNIKE